MAIVQRKTTSPFSFLLNEEPEIKLYLYEKTCQFSKNDLRIVLLRCMGTSPSFSAMFQRETIFVTSCLLPWRTTSSQNGVCS